MTSLTCSALVGVLLLTAAPLAAQEARVYTNADLNQPLTANRPSAAAAARLLAPYQFVPTPRPATRGDRHTRDTRGPGAQVLIVGSPTEGPFGSLQSAPITSGESLTDTNTRFAVEAFSFKTGIPTSLLLPLTDYGK